MSTDYIIEKEHIQKINEMCGGSVRTDAEIETALDLGKGKAVYTKIAYLWRAILVGHTFTDGNKRTALGVALTILKSYRIRVTPASQVRLVNIAVRIARENREDVNQIERLIRYAVEGH